MSYPILDENMKPMVFKDVEVPEMLISDLREEMKKNRMTLKELAWRSSYSLSFVSAQMSRDGLISSLPKKILYPLMTKTHEERKNSHG